MSQITTLTFFKYADLSGKIWAFWMMQFARGPLSKVKGLQLYKLMGSGKTRFNPAPDWSTYSMLLIWDDEICATQFFDKAELMKRYGKKSTEQWTVFMKNITTKGQWSGTNPFQESMQLDAQYQYVSVITRATIRLNMLRTFWKSVPDSQRSLYGNKGLLFSKGIGEAPLLQMATFSLWKDKESLMNFAYRSKEHQQAIQKTKKLDWYKEELFARFQPYKSIGSWEGKNPLPDL